MQIYVLGKYLRQLLPRFNFARLGDKTQQPCCYQFAQGRRVFGRKRLQLCLETLRETARKY